MAQFFHLGGGGSGGDGRGGMAQNHFSVLIPFLKNFCDLRVFEPFGIFQMI